MIFLHELGHFLTAKWAGMKVTEFFLGFGPRSGRSAGARPSTASRPSRPAPTCDHRDEQPRGGRPEDEPRTYRQQSYPKRLLVGRRPARSMHFLMALVLLFVVFSRASACPAASRCAERLGGPPDDDGWTIGERRATVRPPRPPASQLGDRIVEHRRRAGRRRSTTSARLVGAAPGRRRSTSWSSARRRARVDAQRRRSGTREDDPAEGFLGVGAHDCRATDVGRRRRRRPRRSSSSGTLAVDRRSTGDRQDLLAGGHRRASPTRSPTAGDGRARPGGGGAGAERRRRGRDRRTGSCRSSASPGIGAGHRSKTAWSGLPGPARGAQHLRRHLQPVPLLPLDGGHVADRHLRAHPVAAAGRPLPRRRRQAAAAHLRGRAGAGRCSACRRSTSTSSTRSGLTRMIVDGAFPPAPDPPDHLPPPDEPGRRRRRRADHGAVDDDHQDGRRRGHARSRSTRWPRPAPTSCAAPATRSRRPRAWPRSCPARRCRSSPTSTTSTRWRWPRSRPACTACASTPATSASPSTSRLVAQECKDRGVPIRIGVNGGSPRPRRSTRSTAAGSRPRRWSSRRRWSWPTSTRSASTT